MVAACDVVRIVVVENGVGRHDVDAPNIVDHVDQAEQPDPDVFVYVHTEVLLNRGDRRAGAAVSVGVGDLAVTARGQVHVKVARHRNHDYLFGGRCHPDQDHRLGQEVFLA